MLRGLPCYRAELIFVSALGRILAEFIPGFFASSWLHDQSMSDVVGYGFYMYAHEMMSNCCHDLAIIRQPLNKLTIYISDADMIMMNSSLKC